MLKANFACSLANDVVPIGFLPRKRTTRTDAKLRWALDDVDENNLWLLFYHQLI